MPDYTHDLFSIYTENIANNRPIQENTNINNTTANSDSYSHPAKEYREEAETKTYGYIQKEDPDDFYNSNVILVGAGTHTVRQLIDQINKRIKLLQNFANLKPSDSKLEVNKSYLSNLRHSLESEGMLQTMIKALIEILEKKGSVD